VGVVALEESGEARPAVLELGQGVGAAVIYTTAALDQAEIEIKPCDADWEGHHTAVRRRPGQAPVFAALFFGLRAGRYDVRIRGTRPAWTIHITGGRVTEASLAEWAAGESPASSLWPAH
jgi:hypothetical protein